MIELLLLLPCQESAADGFALPPPVLSNAPLLQLCAHSVYSHCSSPGQSKGQRSPPIPLEVLYMLLEDRLPSGLMSFGTNCF